MADIIIPSNAQTYGVPAQWTANIGEGALALFTGDHPAPVTREYLVADSQTIPALTPVGFNADGQIVKATFGGAGSIKAIGIAVHDIVTGVTGAGQRKGASIYVEGTFNPRALNWDASFDTEAKKINAFAGAPTPTNIIVRRPKTATV